METPRARFCIWCLVDSGFWKILLDPSLTTQRRVSATVRRMGQTHGQAQLAFCFPHGRPCCRLLMQVLMYYSTAVEHREHSKQASLLDAGTESAAVMTWALWHAPEEFQRAVPGGFHGVHRLGAGPPAALSRLDAGAAGVLVHHADGAALHLQQVVALALVAQDAVRRLGHLSHATRLPPVLQHGFSYAPLDLCAGVTPASLQSLSIYCMSPLVMGDEVVAA